MERTSPRLPVRAAMIPTLPRVSVGVLGFAFGLVACGALVVVEWAAWTMVTPGRRLGAAEVEAGLGETIETRAEDGTRLAGVWVPAKAEDGEDRDRKGTVLLLHGFAEPPSAMNGRVEALTRCGWDVAALDLRGYGRSEGDHSSFGGREAGDLRAWIDALAGRIGPGAGVAVWGRSMGAAIALRAAAEDPRIAALVLEAPYLDLEETLAALLRRFRLPLPRPLARLALARAEVPGGRVARPAEAARPRPPGRHADPDRPRVRRSIDPPGRRPSPGRGLPPPRPPHRRRRRRPCGRHRRRGRRTARAHRRVPGGGRAPVIRGPRVRCIDGAMIREPDVDGGHE